MDIALVTDAANPGLAEDNQILLAELATYGVWVKPAIWNNPTIDWARPRLIITQACYDYRENSHEFTAWAQKAGRSSSLWNPRAVVEWNSRPDYLEQLAQAGLPVAAAGDIEQPGEIRSLIYIGDGFSHAVESAATNPLKTARLITPEPSELELARQAYAAIKNLTQTPHLLFARFDISKAARLISVELVAPLLFLTVETRAAERLAEEIYRLWTNLQRSSALKN